MRLIPAIPRAHSFLFLRLVSAAIWALGGSITGTTKKKKSQINIDHLDKAPTSIAVENSC